MSRQFSKLTREAMRALKPGNRICEHGIVYEKLPNGDGSFTLSLRVNGNRIHRAIGKESDGITRRHAEQAAEKFKHEGREGRLSLPKGRKLPLTFRDAATQYIERLTIEEGKSLAVKIRQLHQRLVPFFGATALQDIHAFQVEQFKHHCRSLGLQHSTVNRYLAVLSHLLNRALEWGWIEKLPVRVKKYKETQHRIHYLTADEIQRLLAAAKADPHPFIHLFMVIGLETAMRKMEILSIRLQDLDLERRMLFIPDSKTGARTQPLSAHLVAFLRQYLPQHTQPGQVWLFPSKASRTGHMVEIRKPFIKVVKAAGLDPEKIVRHTLRHTAITHLVQAGVDLPTVKSISGHKTLAMVERYAHQNNAHVQEALDKLGRRYGG